MHIRKIEIDGFKSYGQYQCLENLDTQFNAITGLNGSGKSNILDAICFLLGISHLQYIRAENNEELVFKKGQGGITKATVAITFDNTDPKHCPIGYETEKTIVIVLNGKQTYHINNMPAGVNKVSDLFNSCSMNVNNPHFLIMQGRVTKVLNMKPREILMMIEEAAGVRVYESKRRTALNTIEKKSQKIANMNKMMDNEILPRLNKLRGERELYNEYQKLGRDIENSERLKICLEFWTADHNGKLYRDAIEALVEENRESKNEIKHLEGQIEAEKSNLEDMKMHLEQGLTDRHNELSEARDQKNNEFAQRESELNNKKEVLKDLSSSIDTKNRDFAQDKEKLKKKKLDLAHAESSYGSEAKQFEEAQKKLESCKAVLSALERGLVVSDSGQEMSLADQILEMKNKFDQEQTKALRCQSTIDDCRPRLQKLEQEHQDLSKRRTSCSLEISQKKCEDSMMKVETALAQFSDLTQTRERLITQRHQLANELRMQNDKLQEITNRYPFLNFKYQPMPNFNDGDVIGPFARLIRLKKPEYALALDIALGGIISHIVVRTQECAKRLLLAGKLERRVTFIPLDNISYRPLHQKQLKRVVELVGQDNVALAVDLVDFDECNRRAVEYALGNILVCKTPEAAKTVCFDRGVRARVVTFEGDDYRPDGFLTGGSNQRKFICLADMMIATDLEERKAALNTQLKQLDTEVAAIHRQQEEKRALEEQKNDLNFELRELDAQLKSDPTNKLNEQIQKLRKEIAESQQRLSQVQPVVDELAGKLKILEDRQRDETAHLKAERKKAERGLMEAENTVKRLQNSAANVIQQLEMDNLEVETLENQLKSDEQEIVADEEKRRNLLDEMNAIEAKLKESRKQLDEVKNIFDEFMMEYRQYERDIGLKSRQIEDLRKVVREKKHAEENFEPKRRGLIGKAAELEKKAELMERQHSWITEDKEHFNKAGTHYDFRNLTERDILHQIRTMKDRREELDRRVNVNAMRALEEEEERASELDSKRKALEGDRDLLHKTIFEIDAEKKRELEKAYYKISEDFGKIYGTILPGTSAKLQAVDANDLTAGLQIRVAFSNQWKDSLDELSGGQRSLVALSLILAMLKCNPAPIYILDEVDAALDLSHTANIGTMIKQHFKQSQVGDFIPKLYWHRQLKLALLINV